MLPNAHKFSKSEEVKVYRSRPESRMIPISVNSWMTCRLVVRTDFTGTVLCLIEDDVVAILILHRLLQNPVRGYFATLNSIYRCAVISGRFDRLVVDNV